jgi:hypothetical protein
MGCEVTDQLLIKFLAFISSRCWGRIGVELDSTTIFIYFDICILKYSQIVYGTHETSEVG